MWGLRFGVWGLGFRVHGKGDGGREVKREGRRGSEQEIFFGWRLSGLGLGLRVSGV